MLGELSLHTVCQEANCPNRMECWAEKTATFMILGDLCTRGCKFCNIATGKPGVVDSEEPQRVADAVQKMGIKYAVITSVTRDDLPDGGASLFADTVRALRDRIDDIGIEILIPDFGGSEDSLLKVIDSKPDVINHNIETVRRLTPSIRSGADYDRSLQLLKRVSENIAGIKSKSGIMLGLGEKDSEIEQAFSDLASVSCRFLTIGQYLSPSDKHHPVERYYSPDEFLKLREVALSYGFESVMSGPLVRSSYRARDQFVSG